MRDILRFILNHLFAILFVLLVFLSIQLLVNQNNYHRSVFVSSFVGLKGRIHNSSYALRRYLNLNEENYKLVHENKRLRNLLKQNYKTSLTQFIDINDSLYQKWYEYEEAKIINNSVNKQYNYITLNKGANQGIEPEMGVISSKGVVGIVRSVSDNFSLVISLLNLDFRLSAKIERNNYFGSLSWDGNNYQYAILSEIPYHVDLFEGDTIVTSGYSPIFPADLIVGTIESFKVKDGNFYVIKVKLSNDFKQLSNVYTVSNRLKEEQIQLENSILSND